MKTLILGVLTALATLFLETGCDTVDAKGHHVTLVPIMGTDQFGNPTMNWVPASGITAGALYAAPGPAEAPDDYDYDVDPIVYPDEFDATYLESNGFYYRHGHFHRWHDGGPRIVRDRSGHIIRSGARSSVVRRGSVTVRHTTTVASKKK
jgi:hypothetical protein